jgi:hypothetical protein
VHSILIEDVYKFFTTLAFGFRVSGPDFPLVIGCSLMNARGEIDDLPPQLINSDGLAIWQIKLLDDVKIQKYQIGEKDLSGVTDYAGRIMFALWPDTTFTRRLSDTGWINWETTSTVVGASTAGLDMQDAEIRSKYAGRLQALTKIQ